MSISSVKVIMQRIKEATPESKIAVFKRSGNGTLDAMFDSTVKMEAMRKSPNYIGSYSHCDGVEFDNLQKKLNRLAGAEE